MKVLSWGGPDGRKQVYHWVKGDDGVEHFELGPWTSMWEHALALVGFVQMEKEAGLARGTIEIVAETLALFGCHFSTQENRWLTIHDILYSNGAPPPTMEPSFKHITHGHGGVGSWVTTGLLVAREVLGPTHKLKKKLDAYIADQTRNEEAGNRRTAEWWAAVKQIEPA
jgi:hypothetical protein